jgi:hypothetical protein
MNKMIIRRLLLASLIGYATLGSALAEDLYPPEWRGQVGTTFGQWEFSTSDPNSLPELGYIYPYGLPSTQVTPGLFQSWMDLWGGRQGVWPLSGEIVVVIPNRPEPLPYKDILVQLTWAEQAPNVRPTVGETRFGVPASIVEEIPLSGGWYHTTYQMHLEPNPDWERILITGAVNVDEMVIDTRCVPEPSALVLLGITAISLLGYAWRRHRS